MPVRSRSAALREHPGQSLSLFDWCWITRCSIARVDDWTDLDPSDPSIRCGERPRLPLTSAPSTAASTLKDPQVSLRRVSPGPTPAPWGSSWWPKKSHTPETGTSVSRPPGYSDQRVRQTVASYGIDFQIGLHPGECEVRGDDLGGLAVHVAARVAAPASPREILVSGIVKDLVAGSEIQLSDRGEHELKGCPESGGFSPSRADRFEKCCDRAG